MGRVSHLILFNYKIKRFFSYYGNVFFDSQNNISFDLTSFCKHLVPTKNFQLTSIHRIFIQTTFRYWSAFVYFWWKSKIYIENSKKKYQLIYLIRWSFHFDRLLIFLGNLYFYISLIKVYFHAFFIFSRLMDFFGWIFTQFGKIKKIFSFSTF